MKLAGKPMLEDTSLIGPDDAPLDLKASLIDLVYASEEGYLQGRFELTKSKWMSARCPPMATT